MSDLIGQSFGRYHILEQLGEGGMATVYKAFDTRLERDAALKIIRRDAFPPAQLDNILKRFEREAKALGRLAHPNIVPVIDYGEHEGIPYLVMVYLPGGTLKQRLGKPVPWQEAVRTLLPIAHALQFAHSQNIVHRDVKPSNILITLSGEPMLTDFGIAKILEGAGGQTLTGTGVGIGTPEYMAPEQWTGQAGPLSDIYSLGVVLYELVTGRKPYEADTPAAVLLKQVNDPLPRPRLFVPDLPEAAEKLLVKALAREPGNRYPSMEGFVAALQSSLEGGSRPRQAVPPWKRKGPEPGPEAEPEPKRKPVEELPVQAATLLADVKPLQAVPGAEMAEKTAPSTSDTLPQAPGAPPPVSVGPADKGTAVAAPVQPEGKKKIRPVWFAGLAGLVVVIALLILVTPALADWLGRVFNPGKPTATLAVGSGPVKTSAVTPTTVKIWTRTPTGILAVSLTPTPTPISTPSPTSTKSGYVPPTSTPQPQNTAKPANTATNTPKPPATATNTPKPKPTNTPTKPPYIKPTATYTPKPKPTNTPTKGLILKPTKTPTKGLIIRPTPTK